MKYISTRGVAPALNFEEVLLTGLAPDGGLYVPETLPHYSRDEIRLAQIAEHDGDARARELAYAGLLYIVGFTTGKYGIHLQPLQMQREPRADEAAGAGDQKPGIPQIHALTAASIEPMGGEVVMADERSSCA